MPKKTDDYKMKRWFDQIYPGYIFDQQTHQMRINREKQRRLELATEICRALRPFAHLPYEAIAAVSAVLEERDAAR